MNDQDAFDEWFAKRDVWPRITYDEVWHAALAWLRSQGEPVAFDAWACDEPYHVFRTEASARNYVEGLSEHHDDARVVPLYAAPQPAIPDGWQPIETAPEGQDMILAGVMDGPNDWRIKVGHRAVDGETSSYGFKIYGASWEPLMWTPLPAAPEPSK